MRVFRYFAPSIEEQRAFVMQFISVVLGVLLVVVLSFYTEETSAKMLLWGGVAGTMYLLVRAAWQLEAKAKRAEHASIGVDENALYLFDGRGEPTRVAWINIVQCEVRGGKLRLVWPNGKWEVGAREVEQGMDLINEIACRCRQGEETPPTNFIPLSPR